MRTDVQLADPATKLPLPENPASFAPAGIFSVDLGVPFWAQALADGSIVIADTQTAAPPASKSPATNKDVR